MTDEFRVPAVMAAISLQNLIAKMKSNFISVTVVELISYVNGKNLQIIFYRYKFVSHSLDRIDS